LSYILDALRRADAEREVGEVPSLHAQAVLPGFDEGFESPPDRSWRWVAVVLGLLLVGSALWFFWNQGAAQPRPAVVLAAPSVPTGPTAAESVMPTPLPPLELKATPAPEPQPPIEVVPVVPPPDSSLKRGATVASASAASDSVPKKTPPLPTSKNEASKPTKAAAAAPQDVVVPLNELPEAIRREQPKLTIGGAMHSATPANRMLILNGQVFHEGDQVTADLVLEQIKLKSAVLVYKGYRYSISY